MLTDEQKLRLKLLGYSVTAFGPSHCPNYQIRHGELWVPGTMRDTEDESWEALYYQLIETLEADEYDNF